MHYYILRSAEVASVSAFPFIMQQDTRASSLLQKLKYKQRVTADPLVCSTCSGSAQQKLRSWSVRRYVESLRGEKDHIVQHDVTLLLCPRYFLLCQRGIPAWYNMMLLLGDKKKKKAGEQCE